MIRAQLRRSALILLLVAPLLAGCRTSPPVDAGVRTGLDRIASREVTLLDGLRVGVITNQTGVSRDGQHIVDILARDPNVEVKALFGPEHGIRGSAEAGATIDSGRDAATGLPVYSLYGETRKPTAEMLAGLDALVFDIQDIGARFYTYISTMSLAMEAAAENDLRFIVLDRPNPIGGHMVEGPVLDPAFRSFVGIHPIPLRHGMTIGELARLFNEEGWLAEGVRADLTIVPCTGWQRNMIFSDYGTTWVPPSPNIPTIEAALLYPGMGLVETLSTFSEGRGTESPFEQAGSPWLQPEIVIADLRAAGLPGVDFAPTTFTPVDIPGKATNNKFDSLACQGIRFVVQDGHLLESVRLGFHLIASLQRHYPDSLIIRERSIERMTGQAWIYSALRQGMPIDSLQARWHRDGLAAFLRLRANYLLYD